MQTITLLTSGTRGDVTPYIALGHGLLAAGFNVRIAAPVGFRSLVESNRGGETPPLLFAPFEGNPSDLMLNRSEPLTLGRSLMGSVKANLDFLEQASQLHEHMLATASAACRGSDILLYGLPTLWGAHIAEGLGIPGVRAVLQPLTPTRAFASALLPFRANLGGLGNWLSHWIVTQATWLSFRSEINHARRTHFNLPPANWLDPTLRPFPHQPLTLNGFSAHIVPRPTDWNEKQVITGYWRNPEPTITQPIDHIEHFIERHPARTLAVGLGSPGTKDMLPFIHLLDEALKRSDAQAVLTLPNEWHGRFTSPRILPVEYAPHAWLYQRVQAAVHHGGAGTTSASLHAGLPTVTLPLAIDQFFWGERVWKLGVGPQPVPQRALTAQKLSAAIQVALEDESIRRRAEAVSVALGLEDGVQAAVSVMRNL